MAPPGIPDRDPLRRNGVRGHKRKWKHGSNRPAQDPVPMDWEVSPRYKLSVGHPRLKMVSKVWINTAAKRKRPGGVRWERVEESSENCTCLVEEGRFPCSRILNILDPGSQVDNPACPEVVDREVQEEEPMNMSVEEEELENLMEVCTRESSDEPTEKMEKMKSGSKSNRSKVNSLKVKFNFKRSRGEMGARVSFVQAWTRTEAAQEASILPKLQNGTNLEPAHRVTLEGNERKITSSRFVKDNLSCNSNWSQSSL